MPGEVTGIRTTAAALTCAMALVASGATFAAADPLRAEYDLLLKRQAAAEAKVRYFESDTFVRARLGLERKLPPFAEWRAQRVAFAPPPVPKPRIRAAPVVARSQTPTAAPPPAPAAAPTAAAPPVTAHVPATISSLGRGEEFVVDKLPRDAEPLGKAMASGAPVTPTLTAPPPAAGRAGPPESRGKSGEANPWSQPLIFLVVGLMAPLWAVLALVRASRARSAREGGNTTGSHGYGEVVRSRFLQE